jgi:hypothetical protein
MDPVWIDAARAYSGWTREEQASYWARLNPEQRPLLQEALHELSSASPVGQVAPIPQKVSAATPKSEGCARGCARVLGRGCLVILVVIGLATLWSLFPSFSKPSGSRYALWPASIKTATSIVRPIDSYLPKNNKKNPGPPFFPLRLIEYWLASAKLQTSDVAAMSFLHTVQDGGGWVYKDGTIDFEEVKSPVAILEITRSARQALLNLPRSEFSPVTLDGLDALAFANPMQATGNSWYVVAPNDTNLVIGAREGVGQVLAVASGQRDGIATRGVLGPMLEDLERSSILEATFITPTQEASMPILAGIMRFLQSIPGPSLFFSLRAKATAYEMFPDGGCVIKMEYQARGRVGGEMFRIFLWLLGTQSPKEEGVEIHVEHHSGLAKLEAVGEPYKCTEDKLLKSGN